MFDGSESGENGDAAREGQVESKNEKTVWRWLVCCTMYMVESLAFVCAGFIFLKSPCRRGFSTKRWKGAS